MPNTGSRRGSALHEVEAIDMPLIPGLSNIIGNLTARFSLGFTLAEEEKDDGRCTTWKFE